VWRGSSLRGFRGVGPLPPYYSNSMILSGLLPLYYFGIPFSPVLLVRLAESGWLASDLIVRVWKG
jgi:hypothetical protein